MLEIPSSSPYFTQPTQIVNKGAQQSRRAGQATQPTQLLGGRTQPTQMADQTTQPTQSSPFGPSSPSTTIEVPASSPFQPRPRPKVSPFIERKKGVAGRIASTMAPAGTLFRPPTAAGPSLNTKQTLAKGKNYLTISDDELTEDYKHHDSSDDEPPMRGDIKPSSFMTRNSGSFVNTEPKSESLKATDIEPWQIHDIRLRYLVKEVYTIVSKTKPSITLRACRDAVTSSIPWQVAKAVTLLVNGPASVGRAADSPSAIAPKQPTTSNTVENFVQRQNSTQPEADSSHSTSSSSTAASVTKSISSNPPPPRRRLVQGRRKKSPTPPPRKAETELKPEPFEILSDSDSAAGPGESIEVEHSADQSQVLEYLNSCTAESLAQMTGFSAADSKTVVSCRPFSSIREAEMVSKRETKAKAKGKRVQIGSLFVEKLSSWFAAFHAASEVIRRCEDRGKKLQDAMADWPMDKNGKRQGVGSLPVSEKPWLMAEDIQLKSYQLLGLNWMDLLHSKGFSGILADDMGLGKTCQVISIIAHLVGSYKKKSDKPRPWPFLVVVPPSVCENWMAEFGRFAPELRVCPYLGKDRRNMDPEEARKNHVVLTSYSQVEKQKEDLRWLQELDPYAAIFDEGHKLKNRKNLVYKQMMRVPTSWRLILSGTPVQNNLKELLTLLHFVEPDLFGEDTFEQLDTIFEAKVPNKEIHNFAALAKERVSNARAIMSPFILQRRKEDVLDLAKKTEHNILVDMHPKQRAIYDEVQKRYLVPKNQRASSTIKDSHSWMQLRKAAIHHQLFRQHFTDEVVKKMVDILWKKCSEEELYVQSKADRHKALLLENYMEKSDFQLHLECKHFEKYIGKYDIPPRSWEEGPKVQKLLELVRGYMKNGDRVLVFSRFDLVIDILRETLAHANIPYCELTGSTDISDRFPEIERFNNDPDIPVFLLTTGAGGTGLNLTAANKIIIFDQSDNPQDDVQASNRAHRIGQTRDVEVIRLITKDTVEGLIFNSCVKKLMLARIVEGNIPVDDDADSETVEQRCRRLMLLDEESRAAEEA
ncbi:SNF2 family N-terminal domain-containing protein [Poronia punctata]|nr:SNF2 family N-terminal domain-containing protein [Poronia punctata]